MDLKIKDYIARYKNFENVRNSLNFSKYEKKISKRLCCRYILEIR